MCWSVCLFFCLRNHSENSEWILLNFFEGWGNPDLDFGLDPEIKILSRGVCCLSASGYYFIIVINFLAIVCCVGWQV